MNYYGNQYQPQNFPATQYNQREPRMSYEQYSGAAGQSPLMNPSSGIIWVQGEVGARAYPVGAGCSVLLMDSEDKYFYIKSADMSGMPRMHKYYYSEVVEEQRALPNNSSAEGQSYDGQFEQMLAEIGELKNAIQELTGKMHTEGA